MIDDLSYNGFKTVVDIDLLGTYNVSKAAYEGWLRDHGGAIVNVTAAIQYTGMAMQAHVASAKAGIDALTRTCAIEWGPRGIRTNVMAPGGMVGTEGMRRFEGVRQRPTGDQPARPHRPRAGDVPRRAVPRLGRLELRQRRTAGRRRRRLAVSRTAPRRPVARRRRSAPVR